MILDCIDPGGRLVVCFNLSGLSVGLAKYCLLPEVTTFCPSPGFCVTFTLPSSPFSIVVSPVNRVPPPSVILVPPLVVIG